MKTRRYQASLNRYQEQMLPARVEDYVSENNAVRAIDAYVATLDLFKLGFKHTQVVVSVGQPPFNPAAMLKLYLYDYVQHINSSRKLERETHRNLEVIWLVEGVRPTYKSIADFRKSNGKALKASNRDFILLCKELSLLGGDEVGVDGSFFKADASKNSIYTEDKLNKQLEAIEQKISDYQQRLEKEDAEDDREGKGNLVDDAQLADKLKRLQEKQAEKKALQQQLKDSEHKQISTVDSDARLMSKRGHTVAGYNAQIVVDSKHKLIVADDVSQDGNDTQQLTPMLAKAQEILQSENLTGLADSGYYQREQLKGCEDQHITVYVAVPDKSKRIAKQGRFTREQFQYNSEKDCYLCPQGETLSRCGQRQSEHGVEDYRYKSKASICKNCPVQHRCLSEKTKCRQIERWQYETVIERHKQRMTQQPNSMKKRASLVEHPFGTLKYRAGINHFLMRGLEKCRGEFSLMVLAYNFTRGLNILGVDFLRHYCLQRALKTLILLRKWQKCCI